MRQPPYEMLEHTADVGLWIRGHTLAELYANAGMGLMALAVKPKAIEPQQRVALSAKALDREELLVNWLSEILYRIDAEGWLFCRFEVSRVDEHSIDGEAWGQCGWEGQEEPAGQTGQRVDPIAGRRVVAVKAVTYHQLLVRETPQGWEATVYFDI